MSSDMVWINESICNNNLLYGFIPNEQLDEINQLFLPNMRNKLMWFYQEVDEPDSMAQQEQPKPGPSRGATSSNTSKTPQGKQKNRRTRLLSHVFLFIYSYSYSEYIDNPESKAYDAFQ